MSVQIEITCDFCHEEFYDSEESTVEDARADAREFDGWVFRDNVRSDVGPKCARRLGITDEVSADES